MILFVEFLSSSCLTFQNNLASIYKIYRYKKIDSTLLELYYCKNVSFSCFYISLDFIRWKALNFMDWSFSVVAAKNYWLTLFPSKKVSGSGCQLPLHSVQNILLSSFFSHQEPNIVILRNKKFMSKVNGAFEKNRINFLKIWLKLLVLNTK